ncbi:MAG: class I SAM-dependent methyltransferase [Solirubrobacteraceae bacterium]
MPFRTYAREKVAPSTARVPFPQKVLQSVQLLKDHWASARTADDFSGIWTDFAEYDRELRLYAGTSLREARVFEIGYGQRPYRLIALQSMGIDASGVDAEVSLLAGSVKQSWKVFRTNGFERMLKTLVRRSLFDSREWRRFSRALVERGFEPQIDRSRFFVGDAADVDLASSSLELVISEDVFEHIARPSLERLVPRIAKWLKPTGLALIRPNIFTGIMGGHLLEWNYRCMVHPPTRRKSEPWEHLRKRRFEPNTSLNRLTRGEYRSLFSKHFDILDERVQVPNLGREYLVGKAAEDLAGFDEEELFSNRVLFVVRPKVTTSLPRSALHHRPEPNDQSCSEGTKEIPMIEPSSD